MSTKRILLEIERRKKNTKDSGSVIGAEFKSRRTKYNLTLKELCEDICSESYECKIESGTINPSRSYLVNLCERLNISNEDFLKLINLEEYISKMVNNFYLGHANDMLKLYEDILEFDNYRSYLIKMIYYIYLGDYKLAYQERNKIIGVYKSVNDYELFIFALFDSMICIHNFEYKEAITCLNEVIDRNISDLVNAIAYEALMDAYYKINSRKLLLVYEKTINYHRNFLQYIKLEGALFMMYKYCLYNGMDKERDFFCERLLNTRYKNTIRLIKSIYSHITPDDMRIDSFVTPFYEMLYLMNKDVRKFNIRMQVLDDRYSEEERLYLSYMNVVLNTSVERINEYSHEAIYQAIKIKSIYLIRELVKRSTDYYSDFNKYKPAVSLMRKAYEVIDEIEKI